MPSGLRVDTDTWLRDYEQAKQAANDVLALIQARAAVQVQGYQCWLEVANSLVSTVPHRTGIQSIQMEALKRRAPLPQHAKSLVPWAHHWKT